MATFEEVRELLRNVGQATVSEKRDGTYPITLGRDEFVLSEADVEDYLSIRGSVSADCETAIFTDGYYEHVVEMPGITQVISRSSFLRPFDFQLGSPNGQVEIRLSGVSTRFVLAVLDKVGLHAGSRIHPLLSRPFGIRPRYDDQAEHRELREALDRILSVKVSASLEFRARSKQNTLRSIAEAGLFNISYSTKLGLVLAQSWERNNHRLRVQRGNDVQFPLRIYTSDLVAHYQLALSCDSLVLTYLSLYKILEFFFISTAEKTLHKRLSDKISMPDFNYARDPQLREVVRIVRKFDQKTDERRMLAGVVEDNFIQDEIANWVAEYEKKNGQYYTSAQPVLGIL